jgi:aspartokinase-like uncharacterized kinase
VIPLHLTVIKVGGSLFDWPELPVRLAAFLDSRHDQRIALVAGGGAAADVVRRLDRVHALGDETAHRLALHALDLTAHVLAGLLPNSRPVGRIEELPSVWEDRIRPILVPRLILDQIDGCGYDPLPATWKLTSDSIAARIAVHLRAEYLVLLKSASLPRCANREEAVRLGWVDPTFPQLSQTLPCVEYLNLRDSSARLEAL